MPALLHLPKGFLSNFFDFYAPFPPQYFVWTPSACKRDILLSRVTLGSRWHSQWSFSGLRQFTNSFFTLRGLLSLWLMERLTLALLHAAGTPQSIWLMERLTLALPHDAGTPQPIWPMERLTLALLHDAGTPQPTWLMERLTLALLHDTGTPQPIWPMERLTLALLHAAGTPQSIWLMECVLTLAIFMLWGLLSLYG
jgi:hypothetical protein